MDSFQRRISQFVLASRFSSDRIAHTDLKIQGTRPMFYTPEGLLHFVHFRYKQQLTIFPPYFSNNLSNADSHFCFPVDYDDNPSDIHFD